MASSGASPFSDRKAATAPRKAGGVVARLDERLFLRGRRRRPLLRRRCGRGAAVARRRAGRPFGLSLLSVQCFRGGVRLRRPVLRVIVPRVHARRRRRGRGLALHGRGLAVHRDGVDRRRRHRAPRLPAAGGQCGGRNIRAASCVLMCRVDGVPKRKPSMACRAAEQGKTDRHVEPAPYAFGTQFREAANRPWVAKSLQNSHKLRSTCNSAAHLELLKT